MGKRGSGNATHAANTVDQPQSSNPSTKKPKLNSKAMTRANPRRSQRIRNSACNIVSQCRDLEPVLVEASESEEAEHQDYSEETKAEEANVSTIEEKIEIIMLILDEQQKTLKEFLSKGRKKCFTQNSCMFNSESDMTNKYMESQRKIDQLTEENLELRRKLEVSLGKLEGHEKVQGLFSEVIEKLKDTYLISSLAKTTELMANFNRANAFCGCDPAAAKTKVTKAKLKQVVAED